MAKNKILESFKSLVQRKEEANRPRIAVVKRNAQNVVESQSRTPVVKRGSMLITESLDPDVKNSGKGKIKMSDPFSKQLQKVLKGEPKDLAKWKKYKMAYRNIPIVSSAIDITADQAVQHFYIDGENKEQVKKLEKFAKKQNLVQFYHNVAKQMLIYGNAFVEIIKNGEGIVGLKMLDPLTMYVNRDEFGKYDKEKAYIQMNELNPEEFVTFKFEEVVHFKWNPIGDSAYGNSLLHPLLHILEVKLGVEDNLDEIIARYAAPLIHAKVGSDERPAKQEDIDGLGADLQDIYVDTEFVTEHTVEMNVLDSGRRAMDLQAPLNYIEHQVVTGLQVPLALLGRGDGGNRATAEVQQASFDRRTRILQRNIKKTSEQDIFAVHLGLHKEELEIELVWGDPEEKQKQAEFDVVISLVTAGVLTKQKANDLLPPEFREKLPEAEPMPFGAPMGKPGMPKPLGAPVPPLDRVQSGKEKRNPKKVEREADKKKNGSIQKPTQQ